MKSNSQSGTPHRLTRKKKEPSSKTQNNSDERPFPNPSSYLILTQNSNFNVQYSRDQELESTPAFSTNSKFITPIDQTEQPQISPTQLTEHVNRESQNVMTRLAQIKNRGDIEIKDLQGEVDSLNEKQMEQSEKVRKLEEQFKDQNSYFHDLKFKYLSKRCQKRVDFWNICLASPLEREELSLRRKHVFHQQINDKLDLLQLVHYLTLSNLRTESREIQFIFNIISSSPRFSYSLIEYYLSNLAIEDQILEMKATIYNKEETNSFVIKQEKRSSQKSSQLLNSDTFFELLEIRTKSMISASSLFYVRFKLKSEKKAIQSIFVIQSLVSLEQALGSLCYQATAALKKSKKIENIEALAESPNYSQLLRRNCSWINLVVEQELTEMKEPERILGHLKSLKN